MDLETSYLELVKRLAYLQDQLGEILNDAVTLSSISVSGYNFVPLQNKLYLQFQNWPIEIPPLPPPAWINPREGIVQLMGENWNYVFHGNGVTFTNSNSAEEVSIEFAIDGKNAFTPWIVQVFIETSQSVESNREILLKTHDKLFENLLKRDIIIPVDPWLPGSDATFLINRL